MKTTKATKAVYWTTTVIIFLFEGVMPALTSQTEMAKQGIRHLGYPEYFGNVFVIFKVIGTLILIIPQIPNRVKEWAYAGFAFDFIFATISICCVDGLSVMAFFPLIILAILIVSYVTHEKLVRSNSTSSVSKKNSSLISTGIA
jgi:DoxX-like protein